MVGAEQAGKSENERRKPVSTCADEAAFSSFSFLRVTPHTTTMVSAPSEAPTLPLHVTHAGRTLEFSLPRSSPLTDLISQLSSHFDLSPSSLKLVIKGKKISLVSSSDSDQARTVGGAFAEAFGSSAVAAGEGGSAEKPLKALLVGTKRSSFESVQAAESLRSKKHDAFLHHQSHRPPPPSRAGGVHTIANGEDDPERYRFYELQPFPETVPMLEKRMAMLKRLAEDPAVKDVMRRHKFVVGVLCVTLLHPCPLLVFHPPSLPFLRLPPPTMLSHTTPEPY